MEQQKAAKPKSKIMKFLPRAASSVSFQNPPLYSPSKEKKPCDKTHKSNLGYGFSGPLVSMVPSNSNDSRRKIKNDVASTFTLVYEPTSPRVSCMGQVKCKQRLKKLNKPPSSAVPKADKVSRTTSVRACKKDDHEPELAGVTKPDPVKSKKKLGIRSLFGGGSMSSGRKSDVTNNKYAKRDGSELPKAAPCLSTMKRFASGRDAFSNFDWTTQVAPLDSAHRSFFTDDGGSDGDGEEVKIPSSAPVMVRNKGVCDNFVRVGGVNLEPRKEINLWKRRTMAQPKPLQVHTA